MMTYERETEDRRLERAEEVRAYLMARVDIDERSGCWVWNLKGRDGAYGKASYNNYTWRSHRLAYHYLVDYLHRKVPVHHRCGETLCCNPDHLQRTTWQDNAAEMMARTSLMEEIQALRDEVQRLNGALEVTETEKKEGDSQ